MAIAFLVLTILGLISTLCALHPPARPPALVLWAFLPSLLIGEWALQLLVGHVVFVGALTPWAIHRMAGRIGLCVAVATFVVLVILSFRHVRAWRRRPGLEGPGVSRLQLITALPIRPK